MNDLEIADLFRIVRAVCPAQKADEFAPDVWLEVLGGFRPEDASEAVKNLALRQPWIGPSDIAKEVRAIRESRIAHFPIEPVPNSVKGVLDAEELRALRRAIGDGRMATREDLYAYKQWGGSLHLADRRAAIAATPRRPRLELEPAITFPEVGSRL
jgi:hypothetical protein